jgi:hypothetical protein
MWNCVLAGAVPDQAGRTGRVKDIAGSTFKPDPGEMRRVWAAHASARAFHIKPLVCGVDMWVGAGVREMHGEMSTRAGL